MNAHAVHEGAYALHRPLIRGDRWTARRSPAALAASIRRIFPLGATISVDAEIRPGRIFCFVTCRGCEGAGHPSPAAIRAAFSKARKQGSPSMNAPNSNGVPADDGGRSPTGDQWGRR